ncbi:Bifunctional NAD(P)H-hydrate repair enzyme Nnr (Includes: ADP-dependent (S)-NAD(P)H-hydrate dehydratase; NAD(P)H-hydrate epimerase) [uncultured Eubacteriales bacterium]|uniref:Bifunctional NAD(P)H-hydrate repair enzyme n=1 Tax=uncultured Eubacteriales bacterium TaxID=172733 RepID=A0A212JRM8_9FIRM|nr:Bifunctional NAD(P)H-hydrate repair enzyme Nnr (Includes: ADP-dependent (S)-NAD(P)H-hydrate dehydratase; NAD(P)H-hydrate epimerase) [uncultured Eubacteriales bacterium]
MILATAAQMRELDRHAIEERGIPSLTLMENAAQAVARTIITMMEEQEPAEAGLKKFRYLPEEEGCVIVGGQTAAYKRGGVSGGKPRRAVVFCGAGNNGGDGVAVARRLLEAGWEARAVLVGKRYRLTDDAREMERRLEEKGGKLEDFTPSAAQFAAWCLAADVMVDALFGVGLNAAPEGDALMAVQMMNTCSIPVVAVDIATGVEADTGRVLGAAVEAAVTVTFTLPKVGHCVGKGALHRGRLVVADIGIPADLVASGDYPVRSVERQDVRLPRRPRDAHKGEFGKAYIVAGSTGMTGAPVMAAQAAVRSGAGLVTLGVPQPIWPIAAAKLDEAMVQPLPAGKDGLLELGAALTVLERLGKYGVCLIGPGLGRSNAVYSVVRSILQDTALPVVLDADGINALEGHIDVLDGRSGRCTILTPHDAEFKRLGGDLSGGDRLRAAREFAVAHSCCLILKGHSTITAFPDGSAYVNTTGNPGMAKGGSGDVLAGVLVSLLAQGFTPREAAPIAVWLHGCAGDLCAEALGEYGMAVTDLIARLPEAMRSIEDRTRELW